MIPHHDLNNPRILAERIAQGDRVALGRGITLVESGLPRHRAKARALLAALPIPPIEKPTLRIGITGAPGAGKSTFIEAFGLFLIEKGHRVAVLAIDPSSGQTKGSILGDKTRMDQLSVRPEAFIRPSASGGELGGVARRTREALSLVEAAGYDVVLIETVGVGQSEVAVHRMTDVFALLLLPGAGDELQGIKRGIVEMADLIVVNKCDGDRVQLARQAKAFYQNAVHLLPLKDNLWSTQVLTSSALEQRGMEDFWAQVSLFVEKTQGNGHFFLNRTHQAGYWMEDAVDAGLKDLFYQHPAVASLRVELEKQVEAGIVSPFEAAERLLEVWGVGRG